MAHLNLKNQVTNKFIISVITAKYPACFISSWLNKALKILELSTKYEDLMKFVFVMMVSVA